MFYEQPYVRHLRPCLVQGINQQLRRHVRRHVVPVVVGQANELYGSQCVFRQLADDVM